LEEEEELTRLREILQLGFAFWVKNALCTSTFHVKRLGFKRKNYNFRDNGIKERMEYSCIYTF
nr:hypothetical protein [Tanacetum cinerariifolium]